MTVLSTLGRSAAVIGGLNAVGFAITAATGTHMITDLTGTMAFAASVLATGGFKSRGGWISKALTGAVIIWSARLGSYLFGRIMAIDKDERFNKFFRSSPDEPWFTGPSQFPLKLAGFWTIQALWAFVVLLPVTLSHSLIQGNVVDKLIHQSAFRKAGVVLGLTGFAAGVLVESIADWQKYHFKMEQRKSLQQQEKPKWIDSGLWAYSRHPNYFGELCCWWSLSLAGFSASYSPALLPASIGSRLAIGSGYILSPLFLTFLITKVSGVNLLESKDDERYGDDPDYQEYKRKTNSLIPKLF